MIRVSFHLLSHFPGLFNNHILHAQSENTSFLKQGLSLLLSSYGPSAPHMLLWTRSTSVKGRSRAAPAFRMFEVPQCTRRP